MQMIANVAACRSAVRGFDSCCSAKFVDERFGFNHITRFDIKRQIHKATGFPFLFGWQTGPGGWPACRGLLAAGVWLFRQGNWLAQIKHEYRAC